MRYRKFHRTSLIALVVPLLLIGLQIYQKNQQDKPLSATSTATSAVVLHDIATRSKVVNCLSSGPFPDSSCTPGAVIPSVTTAQICTAGYSKSVRNVTQVEKDAVFSEYGIISHTAGQYEIDHFVSLELGGSNDIANLWPEAALPEPGFHQKDLVENLLHDQVCSGKVDLATAQKEEISNWLALYHP